MPQSRRNHFARSPLMRKGGPHEKTRTVERRMSRAAAASALDEWLDELEDENERRTVRNGGRREKPAAAGLKAFLAETGAATPVNLALF